MMLAALLLFQAATAPPGLPAAPANWTRLPALPWKLAPRNADGIVRYVRDEVAAGRCGAGVRSGTATALRIDVAVLATAAGRVRAVVPRAINCPTVEQYTVGLIQRMALDNVEPAGRSADTWYRTTMTFSWSG